MGICATVRLKDPPIREDDPIKHDVFYKYKEVPCKCIHRTIIKKLSCESSSLKNSFNLHQIGCRMFLILLAVCSGSLTRKRKSTDQFLFLSELCAKYSTQKISSKYNKVCGCSVIIYGKYFPIVLKLLQGAAMRKVAKQHKDPLVSQRIMHQFCWFNIQWNKFKSHCSRSGRPENVLKMLYSWRRE